MRYSGASLAYQFGAVLGGGVAAYIGVLSLISGVAVWRLAARSTESGAGRTTGPARSAEDDAVSV